MMKMSIKPVSALRDYNKLLKEASAESGLYTLDDVFGKLDK